MVFNPMVANQNAQKQDQIKIKEFPSKIKEFPTKLLFKTKMTKVFSKLLLMKSSESNFIFFTCILLD